MAETIQRARPSDGVDEVSLFLPPVRDEDRTLMRRVGEMIYTPAVIPRWGDEVRCVGSVGEEIAVRTAARGARLCVHNLLALLEDNLGSLDRVTHVQQLNVLVRCSEGFYNPGRVADGASAALYQVFGERGRHRRSVVETDELPENVAVQVSAIFRVEAPAEN
jgi:enamine deaminase RidA (YjgF/YER057c/UK114 family)